MCEPSHSIVQFDPSAGNDNDNFDGGLPASPETFSLRLKRVGEWLKRVGGLLHLSCLGNGHSEALNKVGIAGMNQEFISLPHTKYETYWWNRTTKIDGGFIGHDKAYSLKCADDYAKTISIGSLDMFRRFIEPTIAHSEHGVGTYIDAFEKMLNSRGRAHFGKKAIMILRSPDVRSADRCNDPIIRDRIVKLVCGVTRKRGLLGPEWADDSLLWKGVKRT